MYHKCLTPEFEYYICLYGFGISAFKGVLCGYFYVCICDQIFKYIPYSCTGIAMFLAGLN